MRVPKAVSLLLVALTTIGAVSPRAAERSDAVVTTIADGVLEGARHGDVVSFLGIPYAAPPTGPNRWRPPVPVRPWPGIRSASGYGASCMQPYPSPTFGPYTREFLDGPKPSEDCLFLNVWRPVDVQRRLPVLVWIHGGGFLGGSGSLSIFNGAKLAAKHVVVVSINYRVGPLGYLAHRDLNAENGGHGSGNYGMLDQIAALRWVRRNIAAFGGDPAQVTIAGQSAGAASVNNLIVSPLANGLFKRAIAESPAMGEDPETQSQAEQDGAAFADFLGAKSLGALRALPASTIQSAVYLPIAPAGGGRTPPKIRFQPVLEDRVLPRRADGGVRPKSNVPLLTGFNADEVPVDRIDSREALQADARSRYGAHADAILALYPHATDADAAASAGLMARDRYLASLILWTNARTRTSGETIYRYVFTHAMPAAPGSRSFGAFHSAEIPYVFGVLDRDRRPFAESDDRMARTMQDYWLAFVRNGDPNSHALPYWRPVRGSDRAVMILGDPPREGVTVSSPERLAAFASFVRDGGILTLL